MSDPATSATPNGVSQQKQQQEQEYPPVQPGTQIYADSSLIYSYHRMCMPLSPTTTVDAIFCLCSLDIRVASYAASLYLRGFAPLLIYSGDSGALTAGRFSKPEALAFADVALSMGVPASAILTEPRATNTGENVRFTHALLQSKSLAPKSFVLVQKPYMERRTYATFVKQWPGEAAESTPEFTVSSPPLSFDEYPDADNPRDLVTSIMIGDLVRIREYPKMGFQIEQEIPDDVWEAGQRLIKAGFGRHLP